MCMAHLPSCVYWLVISHKWPVWSSLLHTFHRNGAVMTLNQKVLVLRGWWGRNLTLYLLDSRIKIWLAIYTKSSNSPRFGSFGALASCPLVLLLVLIVIMFSTRALPFSLCMWGKQHFPALLAVLEELSFWRHLSWHSGESKMICGVWLSPSRCGSAPPLLSHYFPKRGPFPSTGQGLHSVPLGMSF